VKSGGTEEGREERKFMAMLRPEGGREGGSEGGREGGELCDMLSWFIGLFIFLPL
jgi:hypothetical protein